MSKTVNVCILQLSIIPYQFQKNKEKIERYVDKIMNRSTISTHPLTTTIIPDVIVLPEMWNTGFTINHIKDNNSLPTESVDKDAHQAKEFLSHLASKYKVMIIGGSIANYSTATHQFSNLNVNVNCHGDVLSTYAKVHLFSPSKEDKIFSSGKSYSIIHTKINKNHPLSISTSSSSTSPKNTDNKKINNDNNDDLYCHFSSVICYDIRFPEFIRSIALACRKNDIDTNIKNKDRIIHTLPIRNNKKLEASGNTKELLNSTIIPSITTTYSIDNNQDLIQLENQNQVSQEILKTFNESSTSHSLDILFVTSAWPYPRLHHWRTLLMTRAIENQCFVVAANNCGTMDGLEFCGHSMIIDPWGEVLIEGSGPKDSLSLDSSSVPSNSTFNSMNIDSSENGVVYKEKFFCQDEDDQKGSYDEILMTSLSFDTLSTLRNKICVFNDRHPEIYNCSV